MLTILISQSMASKRVVVVVGVAPEKLLVRLFTPEVLHTDLYQGRVAAGAIAEKYFKTVHGIEIVAFVSSVGKIHMPSTVSTTSSSLQRDDDEAEDALTDEFVGLLKTITREEVDKHPTRCPHPETAEKMTQVYHVPSSQAVHSPSRSAL